MNTAFLAAPQPMHGQLVWLARFIAALLAAMLGFDPAWKAAFDLGTQHLSDVTVLGVPWAKSNVPVTLLFAVLAVVLFAVGVRKAK